MEVITGERFALWQAICQHGREMPVGIGLGHLPGALQPLVGRSPGVFRMFPRPIPSWPPLLARAGLAAGLRLSADQADWTFPASDHPASESVTVNS